MVEKKGSAVMKYKGINVEKIKEIQRVKLPNADAFIMMTPKDIENICSNTDSFDAVCNQIKKELEARKNDTEMAIICEMALNYLQSMKDKEVADKEAYNKGLNDAWELAKKLWHNDARTNDDIYGIEYFIDIANDYTPQEALAKLEAYEKEQNEIKVGDVVKVDGTNKDCGIVIAINEIEKKARLMYADTSFRVNEWYLADLKKTGKHIEIQKILEQIAGD